MTKAANTISRRFAERDAMGNIIILILGFLTGAASGGLLAFLTGRPVKAGKPAPCVKRLLPVIPGILLLVLLFCFGKSVSGGLRLFLLVFAAAFCIALAGVCLGLEKRDPKLLELAFVFRIPAMSRIKYIDLPACRSFVIVTICAAGVVSMLLGFLDLWLDLTSGIFG